MRLIDADALKRRAQKVATDAWKMSLTANVETVLNQFIDWIDQADTEEPQWIPCSEPPKNEGTYLVYAPDYRGGSSSAKENYNGVMFSKYKNGKWSVEHGYYERPDCVTAWMPMPEPYKVGEKE